MDDMGTFGTVSEQELAYDLLRSKLNKGKGQKKANKTLAQHTFHERKFKNIKSLVREDQEFGSAPQFKQFNKTGSMVGVGDSAHDIYHDMSPILTTVKREVQKTPENVLTVGTNKTNSISKD